MDDLEKYIAKRKKRSAVFAQDFDAGYEEFKIGIVLRQVWCGISMKADAGLEKRLRAVRKTLRFLSENPRHPSLRTHEFTSLKGPQGEKVFEAYAEHSTPAAYRVF